MAFGPDRLPAAIVLTFDNLGEASELERGTWPADARPASHPSVTDVLPRLLDELAAHELTATFFVEALNCELYPNALREIAAKGHEIGMHGWRHEDWGGSRWRASASCWRGAHVRSPRSGSTWSGSVPPEER